MRLRSKSAAFAVSFALTAMAPGIVLAENRKHDEVRHAVERGEIRSLAEILAAIGDRLPGEVAGVEIEREDGRWVYEFRVVDSKGRLFEVSGTIERTEEK